MPRSRSILRPAILLLLGTVALVAFIAVTGDLRRERNAMTRAQMCADGLLERVGSSGILPLNLSPRDPSDPEEVAIGMEWVSSADARVLRDAGGRILAAWTMPIVRAIGADGRATVWFDSGAFSIEWMSLAEFDKARAKQEAAVSAGRSGD